MYNSFLNYSPSGDHLSATNELDLLKNNKYNKFCIPHKFRKPRLNGGIKGWLQTPIYGLCPLCVKDIAGTRINIAYNVYKRRLFRRAESIRIAKEIHAQTQKKLNDVFKRKLKDIQIAEKLARAKFARRAEEIHLAEEAARVELARQTEENHIAEELAKVEFARRAEEIQLAEEAARVVRDDETAELRVKAENLRIHEEELRVERIRQEIDKIVCKKNLGQEEPRASSRNLLHQWISLRFPCTSSILDGWLRGDCHPVPVPTGDCREKNPSSVGKTSLKTKNRLQKTNQKEHQQEQYRSHHIWKQQDANLYPKRMLLRRQQ